MADDEHQGQQPREGQGQQQQQQQKVEQQEQWEAEKQLTKDDKGAKASEDDRFVDDDPKHA